MIDSIAYHSILILIKTLVKIYDGTISYYIYRLDRS